MKKSAYVILRHDRGFFGVKTIPLMAYTDSVAAREALYDLEGTLKHSTFSIVVLALIDRK